MATVLRSTLRTILSAIKTRLVSILSIDTCRVLMAARMRVPHFQADQDIVLRPRSFRVENRITNMAGRFETTIRRRLDVICRTRLGFDESDRDESWLTDATYGHIAFEESVINALQEFLPTDTSGNIIVHEPMLLLNGLDIDKDSDRDAEQEWGLSILIFDLVYDLDLNLTLSIV